MANVKINNLCDWPLYFNRIMGVGSVEIPANVRNFALLSFEEVQAQIQTNNPFFVGTDRLGSHARLQIVDEQQRRELFGMEEEMPQPELLDAGAVQELLKIRSKAKFAERLQSIVQTVAEKRMLLQLAEQAGSENVESWKVDMIRELAGSD